MEQARHVLFFLWGMQPVVHGQTPRQQRRPAATATVLSQFSGDKFLFLPQTHQKFCSFAGRCRYNARSRIAILLPAACVPRECFALTIARGDVLMFLHGREADCFCVRRTRKLCGGSTCAITLAPMLSSTFQVQSMPGMPGTRMVNKRSTCVLWGSAWVMSAL